MARWPFKSRTDTKPQPATFPTGRSGMRKIVVGGWRVDHSGPMQVVSGPIGKEKVHYVYVENSRM